MNHGPSVKPYVRVLVTLGLVATALLLAIRTHSLEAYVRTPEPVVRALRFHPVYPLDSTDVVSLDRHRPVPVERILQRGQTLDGLLADLGLEATDRLTAIETLRTHLDLRRLRAGDPVTILYGADDQTVVGLEVPQRDLGRVVLTRSDDGWQGRVVPFEVRRTVRVAKGTIDDSLSGAVEASGAPVTLAYRMADVLQWDLDFHRDLRRGDRFEVLYEEVSVDGRKRTVGAILALAFVNRDRQIEAYRYGTAAGYYDGEGRPLQKMFLRSPLKFSRITSRFSPRRFHPVLKTYRPHYGIDYGAPVGTPVLVTARGTVTFAGWNRGGGKTIKVRHANGYTSAYLHLSGYARGIRPGAVVEQGEVIGYVGSTGLSTGPHLDYRVQHQGRWIDPLTIANVKADPITADELPRFVAWRETLRNGLGDETSLDPTLLLAGQPAFGTAVPGGPGAMGTVEAAGG